MKHFNMIVNTVILIFADKPQARKLVSTLSRTFFRHDYDLTFQGIAITSHISQWRIQDFPEGGANPKGGGGRQPIIQANVSEQCIKMKKNSKFVFVDPTLAALSTHSSFIQSGALSTKFISNDKWHDVFFFRLLWLWGRNLQLGEDDTACVEWFLIRTEPCNIPHIKALFHTKSGRMELSKLLLSFRCDS